MPLDTSMITLNHAKAGPSSMLQQQTDYNPSSQLMNPFLAQTVKKGDSGVTSDEISIQHIIRQVQGDDEGVAPVVQSVNVINPKNYPPPTADQSDVGSPSNLPTQHVLMPTFDPK
mmetsp:Transcript_16644/g.25659  ORF Transcript_16644/g.25659 Transcript_16644/m.25659 type:complete len:115 (-) Transcript_16644:1989-2333(-)